MEEKKNETRLVLLDASITSENQLFVDGIGSYPTLEDAQKAMNDEVEDDVNDGYSKENWTITSTQADYDDAFGEERKSYKIKEL